MDYTQLIPIELHDQIAHFEITYKPLEIGSDEYSAWVTYPRYVCTIEDLDSTQGQGIMPVNTKTEPKEAKLIAIERAVESLLQWRIYFKETEIDATL